MTELKHINNISYWILMILLVILVAFSGYIFYEYIYQVHQSYVQMSDNFLELHKNYCLLQEKCLKLEEAIIEYQNKKNIHEEVSKTVEDTVSLTLENPEVIKIINQSTYLEKGGFVLLLLLVLGIWTNPGSLAAPPGR